MTVNIENHGTAKAFDSCYYYNVSEEHTDRTVSGTISKPNVFLSEKECQDTFEILDLEYSC